MDLHRQYLDAPRLTRAGLLRAGAVGALGAAVLPASARAALPVPAPVGDDVGFLQFAVLAESASAACYRDAAKVNGAWTDGERGRVLAAATRKTAQVAKLTAALGADAPARDDYAVRLPAGAFKTRASALDLAIKLERLIVGVHVNAVAFTANDATRLLLGRILVADARQLAAVSALAGKDPAGGLPEPIDLDAAGAQLDRYLTVNGYPEF